jgi:gamma-glutamylcyclotransferase (GGCT)/AIG2-like uncharacterized protein YtfP
LKQKIDGYFDEFAPPGTSGSVAPIGVGRLRGRRFIMGLYSARGRYRVADAVEADPSDEVWGIVYDIDAELVRRSDGERSVMDRIEGHRTSHDPENYRPVRVHVEVTGESVETWTYIGCDEARERCRVSYADAPIAETYRRSILDGAVGANLPGAYVDELRVTLASH